ELLCGPILAFRNTAHLRIVCDVDRRGEAIDVNTSMVQPWPPLDHALTDCLPRPGTLRRYRKQSDGETHAESHLHLPSNRSCHRGRSEHRQPDALVGSHGDPALAMRVLWNATCVSDRKRFPFATV